MARKKKSFKSRAKSAASAAGKKFKAYRKTQRGGGMVTGLAIGTVVGFGLAKVISK